MKKSQAILVSVAIGILSMFLWVAFYAFNLQPQEVRRLGEEHLPVAQSNIPVSSTVEQHGLTIQLTANHSFYTLGEPVGVTITVRNQITTPILIHHAFGLETQAIRVQVAGGDGVFRYYRGPFPVASIAITPRPLNPGEQRSLSFDILYNDPSGEETLPYIYAFAKGGRYQVRAVLSDIFPNETIFSAPITLEMLAPQGIDAQIWRILQTEDTANFLQTGSARKSDIVIATFAAILAQYPNNFYASSMRKALAPYQTTQPQNGEGVQAAQSSSAVRLLSVNDQLFLARPAAEGDVSAAAVADTDVLADLIELTETWVAAWNEQDLDQYAQSYSYRNYTRQDWETGQGKRPYNKLRKRLETLFAENGRLTVEIISFAIGSDEITANAVGQFERGSKNYSFNTMRFVLDDDGVWRLYSPGF